jgi:hypothetical protein
MKYVLIIFGIAILLRLDFILGLFDKASENLENETPVADISESKTDRTIISIDQDKMLSTSPRDTFFSFLDGFHASPEAELRIRAVNWLKEHPKLFNQTLDKELESKIYNWRDHLHNNNKEVVYFILDLMEILPGENQQILKNFFALWMEINMEHFIAAYSKTKDSNCSIATTFGEPIPDDEKLNDYYQRIDSLKLFLQKEKIEPVEKALATNCLLQLELYLQKLAPPTPAPEASPTIPENSNAPAADPQLISPPTSPEGIGTSP